VRFVELEEARAASGVRLVIANNVPSPWSQAALGALDMKGIDGLVVRFRRSDEELKRWAGSWNAPALLVDDEPPRTGWAEIVTRIDALSERAPLIPADDELRVRLFGLANEILGEWGLGWCVRLLMVHASFTTDGREGWPKPVAEYLAPRYGYAPERAARARARAIAVLGLLDDHLDESSARGHAYFLGAAPTALDLFAAVALAPIVMLSEAECPTPPPVRHAFETLDPAVKAAVSPRLLEHRTRMYARHLVLPVRW
jgi:glutathione S-transferase